MSDPSKIIYRVTWVEDSTNFARARLASLDGTGAETGGDDEGNYILQADVASIVCKIFHSTSATPETPVETPTVTAALILDTVATWAKDSLGYNFRHALDPSYFPTDEESAVKKKEILVEYMVTLVTGTVFFFGFKGPLRKVVQS